MYIAILTSKSESHDLWKGEKRANKIHIMIVRKEFALMHNQLIQKKKIRLMNGAGFLPQPFAPT